MPASEVIFMTVPDGNRPRYKALWSLVIAPLPVLGILIAGLGALWAAADSQSDSTGILSGTGPIVLVFACIAASVLVAWWIALKLSFAASPLAAAILGSLTAVVIFSQFGSGSWGQPISTGFIIWAVALLTTSILVGVDDVVRSDNRPNPQPPAPVGPPAHHDAPPPPPAAQTPAPSPAQAGLSRDAQRYQQLRNRR